MFFVAVNLFSKKKRADGVKRGFCNKKARKNGRNHFCGPERKLRGKPAQRRMVVDVLDELEVLLEATVVVDFFAASLAFSAFN